MRRMLVLLLCVALLLGGCQKKPPQEAVVDLSDMEQANDQSVSARPGTQQLTVTDTVAYAAEGEAASLYGAAVYENTGTETIRLTEAAFTFTGASGERREVFAPTLAQYDAVLPGERAYVAAWFPAGTFAAGESLSLAAALSFESCAPSRIPLKASDIFLADNYPNFTTMTGTLRNAGAESCSLNMIYAAFYGAQDELLGVWYFSRNALLDGGESVRFTTHMKALPVAGLSQKAARTECRAFGFN